MKTKLEWKKPLFSDDWGELWAEAGNGIEYVIEKNHFGDDYTLWVAVGGDSGINTSKLMLFSRMKKNEKGEMWKMYFTLEEAKKAARKFHRKLLETSEKSK